MIMNPPSMDIKDILAYVDPSSSSSGDDPVNEFGLVFATNLFVSKEPATPDDTVTIFDGVGWRPHLTLNKEEVYEHPVVQIRVRSRSYLQAWTWMNQIMTRLHGMTQETWNGTLYSMVRCSRAPMLLDWDENSRIRLIASFEIQRRSA